MKEYRINRQEEWNYCLCSVIQGIFDYYDIYLFQNEIANKLTSSEHGFLVNDDNINNLFYDNGFKYSHFWWNQTPFNEPDSLLETEANIFFGWNHHVLLMNEFRDQEIFYLDPKDCNQKSLSYGGILTNMRESKDGFFGLVDKL